MSLRVTNNAQIERSIFDINANGSRLQRTQQDISTGKRIHRPSDDPTANARDMVFADSLSSELATVSGDAASGMSATFTVGVSV